MGCCISCMSRRFSSYSQQLAPRLSPAPSSGDAPESRHQQSTSPVALFTFRCAGNTTIPTRKEPMVKPRGAPTGTETNARFDRLRHRHYSFNRTDRLLSSLAGGDAGAPETRIEFWGRSRELNSACIDLSSNCQPRASKPRPRFLFTSHPKMKRPQIFL